MKVYILCLYTIILGTRFIDPVLSQSFSSISVDLSLCTTAEMSANVNPVTNTYFFRWSLNNGSSENVFLGLVSLDGNGNVLVSLRNNSYTGRYNITNEPSVLSPINAPFVSKLTFMELRSDENLIFIIDPNNLNIRSNVVSLPSCSFTKGEDEDCVENCDKTVLCNKSFFKQCETGKYIEQMCPSDVRLKRINFCDDGLENLGLAVLTILGTVLLSLSLIFVLIFLGHRKLACSCCDPKTTVFFVLLLQSMGSSCIGSGAVAGLAEFTAWLVCGIIWIVFGIVQLVVAFMIFYDKIPLSDENSSFVHMLTSVLGNGGFGIALIAVITGGFALVVGIVMVIFAVITFIIALLIHQKKIKLSVR